MTHYRYTHLMEYLPKRYEATQEQENARREIYDFKDGFCSSHIKNGMVQKIQSLKINCKSDWVVCFIPASTNYKTERRYSELSRFIESETGITSSVEAISDIIDRESGYLNGKKSNPAEDFQVDSSLVRGKNVILIDDIITRGNTFMSTADKLYSNGARNVIGLFVAKTINPDWHN